jgi:hypothetical protein
LDFFLFDFFFNAGCLGYFNGSFHFVCGLFFGSVVFRFFVNRQINFLLW